MRVDHAEMRLRYPRHNRTRYYAHLPALDGTGALRARTVSIQVALVRYGMRSHSTKEKVQTGARQDAVLGVGNFLHEIPTISIIWSVSAPR